MTAPHRLIIPVTILLVGIAVNSFAGSANLSNPRIESLLSAAGFHILAGPEAEREMWSLRATPHTVERHIENGRVVYTYADPGGGFICIGGQAEYQQFKRIVRQVAMAQREAQMTEPLDKPWHDWVWTWKPWKLIVWGYQPD
jgi:hypothetical protein